MWLEIDERSNIGFQRKKIASQDYQSIYGSNQE